MLPDWSAKIAFGRNKDVVVAKTSSRKLNAEASPAMVVIMFVDKLILRTKYVSETNKFPFPSNDKAIGESRFAFTAGPPSPLEAATPVPAIVVTIPVLPLINRIRFAKESAT